MGISQAFCDAVKKRDIMIIRIMLKDSLIIDKSFGKFSEMREYAERHNVDFWDKKDSGFIRCEKPWNEKLLDREMSALISHFTQERVLYIKEMIREVYHLNIKNYVLKSYEQKSSLLTAKNNYVQSEVTNRPSPLQRTSVSNVLLFKCIIEMNSVALQDRGSDTNGKISIENIQRIKKSAEEIICLCNKLLLKET